MPGMNALAAGRHTLVVAILWMANAVSHVIDLLVRVKMVTAGRAYAIIEAEYHRTRASRQSVVDGSAMLA